MQSRRRFLRSLLLGLGLWLGSNFRVLRLWAADSEPPEITTVMKKIQNLLQGKTAIDVTEVEELRKITEKLRGDHGRVTPNLQEVFYRLEEAYSHLFTKAAKAGFQTWIAETGGKMKGPIAVPEIRVPYWLQKPGKLDGFRSSPKLPRRVHTLIIGSGLTGTSTAYHLRGEIKEGRSVALIDMGSGPAAGASGRNGGNIEMMKENFINDYRGFVQVQEDAIRKRFPDLQEEVVKEQALRQAKELMAFFKRNVESANDMIVKGGIKCDASMTGWLRIADTKEENEALVKDVEFAKTLGLEFEIWSPKTIKERTGIDAAFSGRYIKKSGNYHPYKFVTEALDRCIKAGMQYYTGVEATEIVPLENGEVLVKTKEGEIIAKKVVVATNAYTGALVPDVAKVIEPRVSHISTFQHVPNTFEGKTVTARLGDWYANFPKADQYRDSERVSRGTLLVGGGLDTPIDPAKVRETPYLEPIFHEVRRTTEGLLPDTAGVPPLRSWSGPMCFTADRSCIIDFLPTKEGSNPNVVFAIAFNGYGGSQSIAAGEAAAEMVKTGEVPQRLPADLFSFRRFSSPTPLFPTTRTVASPSAGGACIRDAAKRAL